MAFTLTPFSHTPVTRPRNSAKSPRRIPRPFVRCSAAKSSNSSRSDDEVPLELVDGYLDNAKVRPKIDIDADEYMLMWKLRKMLHEDDFNKIFDQKSRQIGEI